MTAKSFAPLRRVALTATPLALALGLAACDGGNDGFVPPVAVAPPAAPAPSPSPSPTPTPAALRNVSACLSQVIPNQGGRAVSSLAVPDTLQLNLALPDGFPNGRRFNDPVVDQTLAMLLLNLSAGAQSINSFANLPLNPPNDNTNATATFPFLGPVNGAAQPTVGTGTVFNFRTDPESSYVRVDRMGNPAVGSVIGGPLKNAFNDANPTDDIAAGLPFITGVNGFANQLAIIHSTRMDGGASPVGGVAAQVASLGFTVCSTP